MDYNTINQSLKKIFDLYKKNELIYINFLAELKKTNDAEDKFKPIIDNNYICIDELTKGFDSMVQANDADICINFMPNYKLNGNTSLDNYIIYINKINKDINRDKYTPINIDNNNYNIYNRIRDICTTPVHINASNANYTKLYHKNYL